MEKSENIQPLAEWAACDGLKGTEKVCLASHLSMYIRVSVFIFFFFYTWNLLTEPCFLYIGWPLGPDGTAEDFRLGGMSFRHSSVLRIFKPSKHCTIVRDPNGEACEVVNK